MKTPNIGETLNVAINKVMELVPAKVLDVTPPTQETPIPRARVRVLHSGLEVTVKYHTGSSQWQQID